MTSTTRSLGREGSVYLIGSIVQRGLPVVILPVLTRLLGPGEVGEVALGLAVANIISILLALGLAFSVVRLVHDDPGADGRESWPGLVWRQGIASSALFAVAMLLIPLWMPLVAADDARAATIVASLVLGWAISVQGIMLSLARTKRRVRLFLVMTLLQAVVGQVVGLALAVPWGPVGYLIGMILGTLTSAALGHIVQRVPWQWRVENGREAAVFSSWFIFHAVALWILNMGDRLLVEGYLGVDVVGAYFVAYVVGTGLVLILDAAQSAWVPRLFASRDNQAKAALLERVLLPYTIATAVLGLSVAMLLPVLLAIASPNLPEWAVSVGVVVTLCVTVRPAYLVSVAVMNDRKDAKSPAIATAVSAAANVLLNLLLLPAVGIIGAAVASAVAYCLQSVLCLVAARRYVTLSARTAYAVVLVWILSVAVTLVVALLPQSESWNIARTSVGCVLILVTALGAIQTRKRIMREVQGSE